MTSVKRAGDQDTDTQKKDHVKMQGKGDIYKLRREVSEETNPADTLILDSQPPELRENKCLLFKPPSLWYFLMVTLAHQCNAQTEACNEDSS